MKNGINVQFIQLVYDFVDFIDYFTFEILSFQTLKGCVRTHTAICSCDVFYFWCVIPKIDTNVFHIWKVNDTGKMIIVSLVSEPSGPVPFLGPSINDTCRNRNRNRHKQTQKGVCVHIYMCVCVYLKEKEKKESKNMNWQRCNSSAMAMIVDWFFLFCVLYAQTKTHTILL